MDVRNPALLIFSKAIAIAIAMIVYIVKAIVIDIVPLTI